MVRGFRIALIAVLSILLLAVALANRGPVTVRLLPESFGAFLGFSWQMQLPLFLVILGAAAIGLLIGFIWEWIREHKIRRVGVKSQKEAMKLRAEVASLREAKPQDEVLALLDRK
ncbi:LapA family protein [Cereibacter sp. SYSU M97828]|nr:LapA family protein [Cereibacter flavus]